MSFYARFEIIENNLYRFDTRIYFNNHSPERGDECIGAIIGKNPGSAKPSEIGKLAKLDKGKDKMLPYVKNRFEEGYKLAGKEIPRNAYVQVWNLFYLCNPNLKNAIKSISNMGSQPLCETEKYIPGITWFAWGGDNKELNVFKKRFVRSSSSKCFFYDYSAEKIVVDMPTIKDSVKHPQGLTAAYVNNYLAKIV